MRFDSLKPRFVFNFLIMPINNVSRQLKQNFIQHLKLQCGNVKKIHSGGELYSVNSQVLNIRCRTKEKVENGSRLFWYSFNYNLINSNVRYAVFITTTEEYFILLPIEVLSQLKERMYEARSNPSTRTFYIDWDELVLILKDGTYRIGKYYRSFSKDDKELPTELMIKGNR